MILARMAWRNLWRNRRRTQLTMMVMVIATSLLIFVLTMNEGILWDLVSNATEIIQGHITVAAPGFLDNPTVETTLPERIPELERNGIRGLCGRVTCFALLSGGQQQRVAVARAIVGNPAVVLADEPTANLDSETSAQLLDLMRKMNTDRKVTFLFSSHDPMVIERARRVIRLHDGRVQSDETRA